MRKQWEGAGPFYLESSCEYLLAINGHSHAVPKRRRNVEFKISVLFRTEEKNMYYISALL